MGDITLFELHFDRGLSLGSGKSGAEEVEEEEEESIEIETHEEEKPKSGKADAAKKGIVALVVLGLLAAAAIAVKKLGGKPPQELEKVDELTEQL